MQRRLARYTAGMSESTSARGLGFWMCLALVIGNMIGSGVFLLPASLAPYGVNSILGWLVTAAGSVLLAIVFARLARSYPDAAGPYVYPRKAFGEAAGFLTAWGYWMAVWIGNAAIVTGTVAYLAELVPAIKQTVGGPAIVSCAIIWILTFLNWRGVRQMGVLQIVTTVLKVMPLLAIVVLAIVLLGKGDASVIRVDPQPLSLAAVTASATLTLWAFLGLESATVPAGSVIDPEKTIPRATLWGTAITTGIYILACSTVVLLLPTAQLAQSTAPFADVVRMFWGGNAAALLALFAFISGFGALNGWILIHGEMPAALARAGVFPKFFARQSKYQTPGTSLFITSGLLTIVGAVQLHLLDGRGVHQDAAHRHARDPGDLPVLLGGDAEARLAGRSRRQGKEPRRVVHDRDPRRDLLDLDDLRRRRGSDLLGHRPDARRRARVCRHEKAKRQ